MLKQTLLLTGLALLGLTTTAAYADSVTDAGSSVVYSLTYASAGTPNSYDVFLTIDTSGYSAQSKVYPDFLDDIAFQLAGDDSDYSVQVLSAPSGDYAGSVVNGGLNANGCNASGNGFYCLAYTGAGLGLPTGASGDVYSFEFLVSDPDGFGGKHGLYTDAEANVEANYQWLNTRTDQIGNQKDNDVLTLTAATPEPSSFMLLGTTLLGGVGVVRRRRSA